MVTEDKSLFTLTNSGIARNCSLTAVLTPPNLKLIQFEIGRPTSYIGLSSLVSVVGIQSYLQGASEKTDHPKHSELLKMSFF